MNWQKRRQRVEDETATQWRRHDVDRICCVCEIVSKYGLPPRVLAIIIVGGERILSKHKSPKRARAALERHFRGRRHGTI